MSTDVVFGCDDFKIAILCALGTESNAIEGLFDVTHDTSTQEWQKAAGDFNTYTTGRIGRHYVVLVYLPGAGKVHAASCATGIRATFKRIEVTIVAGVCGGSPLHTDGTKEIYLGDVIISTHLVQADYGRENVEGFAVKTIAEGNIGLPHPSLRSFLTRLQGRNTSSVLGTKIKEYTKSVLEQMLLDYPKSDTDILFPANYIHKHHLSLSTQSCTTCRKSKDARVIKSGVRRDQHMKDHNVLAFEMEGAGVFEYIPSIVVKGVCDYADSHKNKSWQDYAAVTAAACCKALLEEWVASSSVTSHQRVRSIDEKTNTQNEHDIQVRKECLQSLYSEEFNFRFNNIKLAHPHTCQWVFDSPEFKSWIDVTSDGHNRILWIRGKPGAGKSTLLKHVYQARNRWFPAYAHAGYFFNARGAALEKTRLGMLRFLLHQLLVGNQRLLDKFIHTYSLVQGLIEERRWSKEELENFLAMAIREHWIGKTLLLVDALDECDSDDAREIVAFFEELAISAAYQDLNLFICLSIRYFPNIGLSRCIELNLENKVEHTLDLNRYIADRLRVKDSHIATELLRKANHVFLWAVLVLSSLNRAYDEGADNQTLGDILAETPGELNQIFGRVLGKSEEMPAATVINLQLVLFAYEPLHMQTLYLLGIARIRPERLLPWSQSGMTDEKLKAYITTVSRGLLEVNPKGHYYSERTVQFIHESIRDYLLNNFRPGNQERVSSYSFEAICHENIARACITSMRKASSSTSTRFLTHHNIIKVLPDFGYAKKFALLHIAMVSDQDILTELLRGYASAFTEEMYFFASSTTGDALIRSIMNLQERFSRLEIQDVNWERLLQISLDDPEIMANNHGRLGKLLYEDALEEALLHGESHKAVEILLKAGAKFDTKRGYNLLGQCIKRFFGVEGPELRIREAIAISLAKAISSVEIDPEDNDVLSLACCKSSTKILTFLLQAGANPNAPKHNTPISVAARYGRLDHIKVLLDWGADITLPDSNPLSCAIEWKDEDLAWRLLQFHGADANVHVNLVSTGLMYAIKQGSVTVVRKLLACGADPNMKDKHNTGDAWSALSSLENNTKKHEITAVFKAAGWDIPSRSRLGRRERHKLEIKSLPLASTPENTSAPAESTATMRLAPTHNRNSGTSTETSPGVRDLDGPVKTPALSGGTDTFIGEWIFEGDL